MQEIVMKWSRALAWTSSHVQFSQEKGQGCIVIDEQYN